MFQDADQVLITDSNRAPLAGIAGGSGFTESGGPGSDGVDLDEADQRLPVFTNDSARTQTIAVQEGPVTTTASSYGEPFAYRPEDRPFMAVDGDPTTAWLVADRAPAEGQRIRFHVADPVDHVTLHQPQGAGGGPPPRRRSHDHRRRAGAAARRPRRTNRSADGLRVDRT